MFWFFADPYNAEVFYDSTDLEELDIVFNFDDINLFLKIESEEENNLNITYDNYINLKYDIIDIQDVVFNSPIVLNLEIEIE